MTKIFRTATVFIVFMAASGSAWADPWRPVKYPNENFQVDWSGSVKITPTDIKSETKKTVERATDYLQDLGEAAYIVNVTKVRYEVAFDLGRRASMDALHCKSVTDRPLDMNGIKAVEMVGANCGDTNLHVRARYFTVGKYFYQVMALVGGSGDLSAGDHFIESFKLIEN
jgi:hypothetical protein